MSEADDVRYNNGKGPDFICFGMQKAATRWVYDQLSSHSRFLMPVVKELHYFNRFGITRTSDMYASKLNVLLKKGLKPGASFSEHDRRQARFLRCLLLSKIAREIEYDVFLNKRKMTRKAKLASDAVNHDMTERELLVFYGSEHRAKWMREYGNAFFEINGTSLDGQQVYTGDITPAYALLPDDAIKALRKRYSKTKFFMMVRDPVSRLVSHLQMRYRRSESKRCDLNNPDILRDLLQQEYLMLRRAYPSTIYQRWKGILGDRCTVFFFDDLKADPDKLRQNIVTFITGDDSGSFSISANENAKAEKQKVPLTEEATAILRDYLSDEIERCNQVFGDRAAQW